MFENIDVYNICESNDYDLPTITVFAKLHQI